MYYGVFNGHSPYISKIKKSDLLSGSETLSPSKGPGLCNEQHFGPVKPTKIIMKDSTNLIRDFENLIRLVLKLDFSFIL